MTDPKPEPAFPHPYRDVPGMTLEEAVALAVLPEIYRAAPEGDAYREIVADAFKVADAFMAERAERAKGAKP